MTNTAVNTTCDSDAETVQGSSDASVDIITERDSLDYASVSRASPRKPLPAQWLSPSSSAGSATACRSRAQDDTKAFSGGCPTERKTFRGTQSSTNLQHTNGSSFLTKEALDAVDANITSPTLRHSPSKAKVPWNSPTVSQKFGSLRHSASSLSKSSPPRTAQLGAHVTIDHRRAPSSVTSTGATSFHTAHDSPVRSPAISQASFSSAEEVPYTSLCHQAPTITLVDTMQRGNGSSPKVGAFKASTLRSRASRPELSITIPPPERVDAELRSASTLASATSNSSVDSPTKTSRIPRISLSKGSSARAPTLSSTLKQTKSAQTLRTVRTTKQPAAAERTANPRSSGAKSMRHVRTVDSTGATPIIRDRKSRDFSTVGSIVSIATTARTSDVDRLTAYLENTALETSALNLASDRSTSPAASQATSTSTVRAPQATRGTRSSSSAERFDARKTEEPGRSKFTNDLWLKETDIGGHRQCSFE